MIWVSRTSGSRYGEDENGFDDYSRELPPCEGAQKGRRPTRQFYSQTFDGYRRQHGEPFTAKGSDHRIEEPDPLEPDTPLISRLLDTDCWYLDMHWDEALEWITAQDHPVIVWTDGPEPRLEIYDDYRE
jgi:hypothetical protein